MSTNRPIAAPEDFPRVYFNRFARKGRGGKEIIEHACYSYDSYTNEMGKSVKTNTVRIGVIRSEDGLGTIEFNDLFLRKHPHFEQIEARRVRSGKKGRNDVLFFAKGEGDPVFDAKPQDLQSASPAQGSTGIIKFGLVCFWDHLYRSSLTCRALNLALAQDDKLRADAESLLMYAAACGAEDLHDMQSWARERILPSEASFDEDCLDKILEKLNDDFILRFYQNKHDLIMKELESEGSKPLFDLQLLLGTFGSSALHPQGLRKGGVMVLFEPQTCQAWFHREIGNQGGQDECFKSVLEHCCHDRFSALIAADQKHWSVPHVSYCYQNRCHFLFEAKLQATALKKIIEDHTEQLYAGNECDLIENDDETYYGLRLERQWSWFCPEEGRIVRSPVFLYIFFDLQNFMPANKKLFKIKEAINKLFDDHKEASARAVAAHTKKPAMPALSSEHRRLIRAGFLLQDPSTGRCAINKEQIFYYQMLESCRVLVSDIKMPVKEACSAYRKLDVLQDFGPIFNQELLTDEDNKQASAHHEALLFLKTCAAQLHAQLWHTVNQYSLDKPKAEQARLEAASLRDTLASLDDIKASCDGGLISPSASLTADQKRLFRACGLDPEGLKRQYEVYRHKGARRLRPI